MKKTPLRSVSAHYDAAAENYSQQYERSQRLNLKKEYPANYYRLQLLLNSFVQKNLRRVIEVGVGEATPLLTLANAGIDVCGFDISEKMVAKGKANMRQQGLDPKKIFWGDIQDPTTYAQAFKDGPFDGLVAMGVMPHVTNDEVALRNMSNLVRTGGSVFVEFRNKLFSMFTFNRYTADFILNDLLKDVDDSVKSVVAKDLEARLRMDMPPVRKEISGSNAPGFDAILSKFHNPFEVVELFERLKFKDVKLRWYHYHPAMPYLNDQIPESFRLEATKLEHETSNWRGYFLCSAFVVEAVKAE